MTHYLSWLYDKNTQISTYIYMYIHILVDNYMYMPTCVPEIVFQNDNLQPRFFFLDLFWEWGLDINIQQIHSGFPRCGCTTVVRFALVAGRANKRPAALYVYIYVYIYKFIDVHIYLSLSYHTWKSHVKRMIHVKSISYVNEPYSIHGSHQTHITHITRE